jgi:hypothetical protein
MGILGSSVQTSQVRFGQNSAVKVCRTIRASPKKLGYTILKESAVAMIALQNNRNPEIPTSLFQLERQ